MTTHAASGSTPGRRCFDGLRAALLGWMSYALIALCLCVARPAHGAPLSVTPDDFNDLGLLVAPKGVWLHHPGDDPRFAARDFDDTAWEERPSHVRDPSGAEPPDGWYRIHLVVSPELSGETFFAGFIQNGAIQAFVDGELVHQLGSITDDGSSGDSVWVGTPFPVRVELPPGRHVVAVRYRGPETSPLLPAPLRGFDAALMRGQRGLARVTRILQLRRLSVALVVGMSLAITLLHVLMFSWSSTNRENLDLALFSGSVMLVELVDVFNSLAVVPSAIAPPLFASFKLGLVAITVTGAVFMRRSLGAGLGRVERLLRVGGGVAALAAPLLPRQLVLLFALAVLTDWLRSVIVSLRRRTPRSWILATGLGALLLAGVNDILSDLLGYSPPVWLAVFQIPVGITILLCSMSAHAALRFTDTERRYRERDVEAARLGEKAHRQELELIEAEERKRVLEQLQEAYVRLEQTQTQLIQSEKLASLGRLVAGIAHEINTPLGAIHSTNQTLGAALKRLHEGLAGALESLEPGPRRSVDRSLTALEKAVGVIDVGSTRVQEIVRRLRSFARLDEAELQVADINRGLEDTVELVRYQLGGRTLELELAPVGSIECYPAKLNQVVLNLLVNSVQATSDSGRVSLRSLRTDRELVIEVSDDGTGISPEHLDKIFDPGFTTKGVGVGTGLGLSICHGIVNEHGGRIVVESTPGAGTTMRVEIPVRREASREHADRLSDAT